MPPELLLQERDSPLLIRRKVLVGLALLASASRPQATNASTVKRVGLLAFASPADGLGFERSFLAALTKRGWAVGKNIAVSRAYEAEKVSRLSELADDLVRSKMDVIVTAGSLTTITAARATNSIPIVFAAPLPWAIEQGLIDSFGRPGHNVTGAGILDRSVFGKRLEYLKQLVPSATRLAWFQTEVLSVDTLSGGSFDLTPVLTELARKAGFEPRFFAILGGKDMTAVLDEIYRWGPQALTAGSVRVDESRRLAEWALRLKIPSAFPVRAGVEAGGLLSYAAQGAGEQLLAERAAEYVDRILRGARPATLPVDFPTRYELVINAKTAETFGLAIPQSLLLTAELTR